jgi:hypothetical protein
MAAGSRTALVATKEGRTRRCWRFARRRTPAFSACAGGLFEAADREVRAAVVTDSVLIVAGTDHAAGRSAAVWLHPSPLTADADLDK